MGLGPVMRVNVLCRVQKACFACGFQSQCALVKTSTVAAKRCVAPVAVPGASCLTAEHASTAWTPSSPAAGGPLAQRDQSLPIPATQLSLSDGPGPKRKLVVEA